NQRAEDGPGRRTRSHRCSIPIGARLFWPSLAAFLCQRLPLSLDIRVAGVAQRRTVGVELSCGPAAWFAVAWRLAWRGRSRSRHRDQIGIGLACKTSAYLVQRLGFDACEFLCSKILERMAGGCAPSE